MIMSKMKIRIKTGTNLPRHSPFTSRLRISPGSHSANTSKGRQQTSQSVVNRWDATLVSIISSEACPQKGHWTDSEICMAG